MPIPGGTMGWWLKKDGQDYCPLCWQAVPDKEKPNTSLPPDLRLSGNHPLYLDAAVFERQMREIGDADFWQAFDLEHPGLVEIATAATRTDWAAAAHSWQQYWRARRDSLRLYRWAGLPDQPFLTPDEYRAAVEVEPDLRADILRQADDVVRHNFGYGRFPHQFGPVVDFNHDFGIPGFKYGWHYWLWGSPVVGAYVLTGDTRYADALAELFCQWYAQRNHIVDRMPGFDADVVWYELGMAVRTPVLLDAYRALGGAPSWDATTGISLLKTVLGHCRWLYQCSSRNPYHAYNWPIQTAVTLGYAGAILPEFREAAAWRQQAQAVISEHLERDFLPDGGYQERTPGYTTYVTGLLETYAALRCHLANDRRAQGKVNRVLEPCLSLWAEITTPFGTPPPVNDTRRDTEVHRLLRLGARRFQRLDFLGPTTLATAPGLVTGEVIAFPARSSAIYPDTGYAVMRSDWTRQARYLFVNFAPFAVHTHEDVLSFECYADGAALAVDPGIAPEGYGVAEHAGWYRAARGHNMLCVEEANPIRHLAQGEDVAWDSRSDLDFFAATHRGYAEEYGVVHRRHIVFVKPHYW
ncbi:MAG: alginate lyase family protein, partial [Anaerolineae bacterium]|nr:alginate lyase family protein [Anaerolineae bacterium]